MGAGLAALNRIQRSLAQLSRVPSRAAADASVEIKKIIAAQFSAQRDPYGKPWAPHAPATIERHGRHPVLNLTGAMKAVDVRPASGTGIRITLGEPYSRFHQTGFLNAATGRRVPARPILPDMRGIPPSWHKAIGAAADRAFGDEMRRAS